MQKDMKRLSQLISGNYSRGLSLSSFKTWCNTHTIAMKGESNTVTSDTRKVIRQNLTPRFYKWCKRTQEQVYRGRTYPSGCLGLRAGRWPWSEHACSEGACLEGGFNTAHSAGETEWRSTVFVQQTGREKSTQLKYCNGSCFIRWEDFHNVLRLPY